MTLSRYNVTRSLLAVAAGVMLSSSAFAHGENNAGPHGGEIRMPGAFHVEAVAKQNALQLYLLDMQFENPRLKQSQASAVVHQDGQATELDCRKADQAPAFRCPLPDGANLQRGTLVVDATRNGKPAKKAKYELPLAFSSGPAEGRS